jgi:lipoate-protein ligase A
MFLLLIFIRHDFQLKRIEMASNIDEQIALLEHDAYNFKFAMRISGGFTVFSTLMSLYLIVFKSPDAMRYYKPFLLNIVVRFY